MDRRELLKMIALVTGGAVIGGSAFLTGCNPDHEKLAKGITFTKEEIDYLNEVGDTILPATKSPGAKAANVGAFMAVMVNDCYEAADQKVFYRGISQLDKACEKLHGTSFIKASPAQRTSLLEELDKQAKAYQAEKPALEEAERKKDKAFTSLPNHYFTMMKQLTLLGFFTSEPGCKEALRYIAIPGKYEGSVPYKKGDKAWA
jgi:hypothetical protein